MLLFLLLLSSRSVPLLCKPVLCLKSQCVHDVFSVCELAWLGGSCVVVVPQSMGVRGVGKPAVRSMLCVVAACCSSSKGQHGRTPIRS